MSNRKNKHTKHTTHPLLRIRLPDAFVVAAAEMETNQLGDDTFIAAMRALVRSKLRSGASYEHVAAVLLGCNAGAAAQAYGPDCYHAVHHILQQAIEHNLRHAADAGYGVTTASGS
jgi:hypothetical protein